MLRTTAFGCTLSATASCYQGIADLDDDDGASAATGASETSGGEGSGADDGPIAEDGAGPMPLHRLTRLEYNNTVRDLLGDTTQPADALPGESVGGSGFATAGIVSTVDARRLMDVAEDVANRATADLGVLLPCDPVVSGEDECAQEFIADLARRAYRRPLHDGELDALVGVYAYARDELEAELADALRLVLQAVLQSPQFLYRWEQGHAAPSLEGELVVLTDHEIASRLSYFLWSSMPDAELFAAAEAGELGDVAGIEDQARRMLADSKAFATIDTFHTQWLGLANLAAIVKSPTDYPSFDPELAATMAESTGAFVRWALTEADGRVETLLTSNMAFVDERLAAIYGLDGITGDSLQGPIELPADRRAGLLTSAGFLAMHANAFEGSPMTRGKVIREKLIACASLPPPPMDIEIPELPPPDPNVPIRERYEAHASVQPCVSCHRLMDPIGFGLGNFDAVGGWIDTDAGQPIDATGVVTALDGNDVAFDGPIELAQVLAGSDEVRRCIAIQWLRFALGRRETDGDDASFDAALTAFVASDHDIRELLVALATSQTFRYRAPAEGEALP